MKPADIITAIHAAGAQITTDGITIRVDPSARVQPMVMNAVKQAADAPDTRDALVTHLIETGRLHGTDGPKAAEAAQRLCKGREMLWTMERDGQMETERYRRLLAHFCGTDRHAVGGLLGQYQGFCDASRQGAVAA